MSQVVFLLGAGFNCSILDPSRGKAAPLARNFFQVLIEHGNFELKLRGLRVRIYLDLLLDEIRRYWHLDLEGLRTQPFDIEECLTLFESQLSETTDDELKLRLRRAQFALRQLLLMYLGDLSHHGYAPTAQQFGVEVLDKSADVLTFNYDTLAEEAIAFASGFSPKTMPDSLRQYPDEPTLADEDLDASNLKWRPALAYGFEFDEVTPPISGTPPKVEGARYYAHPGNKLYESTRVLKLHGSIDWLRYRDQRLSPYQRELFPVDKTLEAPEEPPGGTVLERFASYWMSEPPTRGRWQMEPIVIPPLLYKDFRQHPFPAVWNAALETLSECETLVVIGYSFPPTDFRTRRLFLEAFSEPTLKSLVVINPDRTVTDIVRHLTHFNGAVETYDDLQSFYGVRASWFEPRETSQNPASS